ncbi:MAG: hypothetical protein AB8B63_05420 [Granulosicoccus sp.]
MSLALAIAAIMGAAIGWIIHRTTQARHLESIRQTMLRQQLHLQQTQTEVAQLKENYDALTTDSAEKIAALEQENRQIPYLNSNLEKSQLLVRQMIQKHEAQVRDLTTKNEELTARLKRHQNKEQLKNSVEAERDSLRREQINQTPPQKTPSESIDATLSPIVRSDETAAAAHDAPASESPAEKEPQEFDIDNPPYINLSSSRFVAAEAPEDPYDAVVEVGAAPLQNNTDNARQPSGYLETLSATSDTTQQTDFTLDNSQQHSEFSLDETGEQYDFSQQSHFTLDETGDYADHTALPDGSSDSSTLFEPVDQHDDLQQIFGIGPLTEKALNELGITSYSQLADLETHDIQRIADSLDIVPGRIERDNWVGSARRQLEDVLKQL